MEIIEGNKLIAEFMGAVLHLNWSTKIYKQPADTFEYQRNQTPTKHSSTHWLPEELEYHTSWDWLMPVVEKIESLDWNININGTEVGYYDNNFKGTAQGISKSFNAESKIESVRQACIQFIQWYNTQSKPTPQ